MTEFWNPLFVTDKLNDINYSAVWLLQKEDQGAGAGWSGIHWEPGQQGKEEKTGGH